MTKEIEIERNNRTKTRGWGDKMDMKRPETFPTARDSGAYGNTYKRETMWHGERTRHRMAR
jgi:hypothetical protein